MKITEHILTKNPCYAAGRKIEVKGLMLHSVGCPQPDASVFLEDWNRESYRSACVHGFIDGNDGSIYQTLPWNHRGWHCGRSGNGTHIGIEMCEPACISYTKGSSFTCSDEAEACAVVKRTYEAAIELFAFLCERFSLDPLEDGVILSHREGCERGIASNHGDPEHLWNGLCTGYTMDEFRKDVYRIMKKHQTEAKEPEDKLAGEQTKEPVDDQADEQAVRSEGTHNDKYENSVTDYMVRVRIPDLNIRTGPGTDYPRTGKYTGIGAFTIADESKGRGATVWGKLKSGAGWISLDHAERISD